MDESTHNYWALVNEITKTQGSIFDVPPAPGSWEYL